MSQLIVYYGSVYRLSERNYKRFLKTATKTDEWDLKDFGTPLGGSHNFTDYSKKDYAEVVSDDERITQKGAS